MDKRTFFHYLAGSYIIAAVLNIGFGLIVAAPWKVVLGGTMMLGLILFAVTLVDHKKRQAEEQFVSPPSPSTEDTESS